MPKNTTLSTWPVIFRFLLYSGALIFYTVLGIIYLQVMHLRIK